MEAKKTLNAASNNINSSGTDFNSLLKMADSSSVPEEDFTGFSESSEEKPQAITQSLEIGGENSKEITFEEASSQLQSDDPWLQRKMAEKQL